MALPTVARAKALWDFAGGAPTDLPLRAGQIVNVTRKVDANWWEGELDGKVGIFPVQYVQEVPLESSPALPTRPAVTAQPAPSGPVCVTCAKIIPGDVLRWQGGAYHPGKCLCCKRCLALLGTDSVIKKVGTEPHCQVCFNELMFGPPKAPAAAVVAPAASVAAAPRPLPRAQPTPPVAHAPAHAAASPPVPAAAAHAPAVHSPVTPVRPAPPTPAPVAVPVAAPVAVPVAAPVAAPVQAEPTPPPLPARQGSNITHRPAPPVPGLMATPAPPPAQQPQPQAPLVPHRAAPPPPPAAAAEPTPPPVPYASRPAYTADQPPPAPYASRPAYGSPAAANYHSPPPATSPPPNNGMLMARPTGVIAHPNKPAPISPRGEQANPTPAYQPALKPGEAYIPPPPPPQVPVIIPPLNPYSTNKKVKAVFVGDPGIGKTAFLHAAVSGVFYQAYAPSIEGGLFNVTVFTDAGKTAVDLELYDTPGDFYANPEYRYGLMGVADVIVVMFDQLNRASYEHAENLWYAEIRDKYFTLKPLIIIATKSDQVKSQTRYDPNFVRHQECLDFAQRVDAAKFIDSSAQKNIMLRETLEKIAKLGTSPLSVIKGNKRVERVQTEKKKEGKRGVFGSLVDHVKYGM